MKQAFAILFTLILCLTHATAQSVVTIPLRQNPPLCVIAETVTVDLPSTPITIGADVTVSGGDGTYTYKWTDSQGTVIGSASTLTITTPGEYYLQVTDGGQCAVTTKFTATSTNAISAVNAGFLITRQGDNVHIVTPQPATEVRILNSSGMLLRRYRQQGNATTLNFPLPRQHGIYIIAVAVKGGNAIVKRIAL